jgi:hypothetical protein
MIQLDNLEFMKISRDFQFFWDPHYFFTHLKYSLGEAWGVFFMTFLFWYHYNIILHFEIIGMKWVFFLIQVFVLQSLMKSFHPQ